MILGKNIHHVLTGPCRLLPILVMVLCCVIPVIGYTQQKFDAALDKLDKQEYEKAERELHAALEQARSTRDRAAQGKAWFYLGLKHQQQVEEQGDRYPHKVTGWLRSARESYEHAARHIPDSGGLWNNLAQIYDKLGYQQRAARAFQKAVGLTDAQQILYTLNYADFLNRSGKSENAARLYEFVLQKQPANDHAHQALLNHNIEKDPAGVCELLRTQLSRGQVMQVFEYSTNLLEQDCSSLTDQQKEEVLTIVVMCMTQLSNQLVEFRPDKRSEISLMRALKRLEVLKRGRWARAVGEILSLYEDPNSIRQKPYDWWVRKTGPPEESPAGGWPLETFQSLIRSLGDRIRLSGNVSERLKAEEYYLLSLRLNESNPDAKALVKLVDHYAGVGKRHRIRELLDEEEERIFGAQSAAIRRIGLKRRYEYHRSLGIIYSSLGQWGDMDKVQSAVFQLDSAIRTAQAYNRQNQSALNLNPIVEVRLVNTLAEHFALKGQAKEAFELRTSVAHDYEQLGRTDAALRIFRPIAEANEPSNTQPSISDQYRMLKRTFTGVTFGQWSIDSGIRRPTSLFRKSDAPGIHVPNTSVRLGQPPKGQLLTAEITRLSRELQSLIDKSSTRKLGRDQFMLLGDDSSEDIVKVEFDGKRGKILIRRRSGIIECPFIVAQPLSSDIGAFQAIRP